MTTPFMPESHKATYYPSSCQRTPAKMQSYSLKFHSSFNGIKKHTKFTRFELLLHQISTPVQTHDSGSSNFRQASKASKTGPQKPQSIQPLNLMRQGKPKNGMKTLIFGKNEIARTDNKCLTTKSRRPLIAANERRGLVETEL